MDERGFYVCTHFGLIGVSQSIGLNLETTARWKRCSDEPLTQP